VLHCPDDTYPNLTLAGSEERDLPEIEDCGPPLIVGQYPPSQLNATWGFIVSISEAAVDVYASISMMTINL
jgi:hypothetical protein